MLYSVLVSAFQFLQNLNHDQGKLQVDNDLVKLKVLYKSRVSHFFFSVTHCMAYIYIYIYICPAVSHTVKVVVRFLNIYIYLFKNLSVF